MIVIFAFSYRSAPHDVTGDSFCSANQRHFAFFFYERYRAVMYCSVNSAFQHGQLRRLQSLERTALRHTLESLAR